MAILDGQIKNATKWSGAAEIAARLVAPVTSIVLARLLTPEAFGIVATITMIISFSEIFTDAGFQKYLIQHEFRDEEEYERCTTVAFWSNLLMSFLLWGVIALFNEKLAILVGNPGMGGVIVIACISLPMSAFSSIQMALYKRKLDFKSLFKARMVGVVVPLFVTIPLALWLKSFWALIIGTIVRDVLNAVVLTVLSAWKPRFFYSWHSLKAMFAFSVWSVLESVAIWLTCYLDVFVLGVYLTAYHVGVYKTAVGLVGQITAIVTAATTPVLFSALSRVQNDRPAFENLYFRFMKMASIVIIPLGIELFCFRQTVVGILLGDQWGDAIEPFGLWAFSSALVILLCHYSSEVYRSLGKPIYSVLAQISYMVILIPALLLAVQCNFRTMYITAVGARFVWIFFHFCIMYFLVRISPLRMLRQIVPSFVAALGMAIMAFGLLSYSTNVVWEVIVMPVCAACFFGFLMLFPTERGICLTYLEKFLVKIGLKK